MKKSQVLETIQDLPDEFSIEDLIERFIVLQKIDVGIQQADDNKIYTEEKAKKKLEIFIVE
ncbi:hypothetical protein FW774_15545 [Pedobacter sp. BS3]|uniref:hypothetical protein n=1 Tax=Pedobacter sp. BS3 TaxID=2567937 RepID=UPI0011F02A3D|nr:hypothetical protein [Pedobacter sp. BS3]TZF82105.1 hypothetical protein FW774_15545 [Pedobacter sp. BS3]